MNIVNKLVVICSDKPVVRSLLKLIPYWMTTDTLMQQRANEIKLDRRY
jgi:hypothetical protein